MYKMPGILGALVCAAAIFSPTCALADKTISTVSDWDGATYVDPFGYPNAATFGQSFTAPIYNHTMTSFTFYLEPIMSGSDVGFTAYIYQWDKSTDTAVGSPVFTSSQLSTAGMAADEYSAVTINTGDLDLIPNGKYIAFFSASGTDTGNVTDPVNVGFLGHDFDGIDDYDGGGFFYLDNGSDTSQFTSGPWLDEVGHGKDSLAFSMTFTEGSITTADSHAASELSVTDESEPGPLVFEDWGGLPAAPTPPEANPTQRAEQLADPYSDWGVGDQIGAGITSMQPPAYLTDPTSAQPDVVQSSLGAIWGDGLIPELQGIGAHPEVPGSFPQADFAGFVRRFNTTDYPYTTVCKLRMTFTVNGETKAFTGSGVLIGAKYVLTAAHNIYDKSDGGFTTGVTVRPGLNGIEVPFGTTNAVYVNTFYGWTHDENYDADMALLTLANNAGNTGTMGYTSGYDNGQNGNLAGYPGFQDFGLGQYWKAGATNKLGIHRVSYPMNGPPGMSGGPVYKTDNDNYFVFAVHSTYTPPPGSNGTGKGCRIDPIKYAAIQKWMGM